MKTADSDTSVSMPNVFGWEKQVPVEYLHDATTDSCKNMNSDIHVTLKHP